MNASTDPSMQEADARADGGVGRRERILRVAAQLFGVRGFHRVQIVDVCREANVATGTFYRYFADKDDLLYELLDQYFGFFVSKILELRRSINLAPPAEKAEIMHRAFSFALLYNLQHPHLFMAWYRHGYGVSEKIDRRIWAFTDDLESIVAADLRGSQIIDAEAPEAIAQAILGMTFNLTHRMIVLKTPTVAVAARSLVRMISTGLLGYAPADVATAIRNSLESKED